MRKPKDFVPTPNVGKEPLFDFPKSTVTDRKLRQKLYAQQFKKENKNHMNRPPRRRTP
jgi:hypothetical protein